MSSPNFHTLLRDKGLRATAGRLELLRVLSREKHPVTIDCLAKKLADHLDTVTLYRALEAFKDARIVERADLQHGHAHYELLIDRPHHHHVVCRSCGKIEDIEIPHAAQPEKEAERRAKTFSVIDSYTLEFFGQCVRCT